MGIFDKREAYKPFEYPEIETSFIYPIQDTYWVHREIEFDADIHEYKTALTVSDKDVISRILRTFAEVETHVADDMWSKIGNFLPKAEFCWLGYVNAENEGRHANAYFFLNEQLGLDEFEPYSKDPILSDKFENLVSSSLSFEFDKNNIEHIKKFAFGLAVFSAFTERVALFGQFMIMKSFSCNGRNLLKNIGNIIDWSKQDEALHGEGGIYLFQLVKNEYPEIWTKEFKASVYTAFRNGMDIEIGVINDIFDGNSLPNLTKEQVINYMKYLANKSLLKIGLKEAFDIEDELTEQCKWFENESQATQMTDFFATRPTGYGKNQVAFTSDSVKVSGNFKENLETRFIHNDRL